MIAVFLVVLLWLEQFQISSYPIFYSHTSHISEINYKISDYFPGRDRFYLYF